MSQGRVAPVPGESVGGDPLGKPSISRRFLRGLAKSHAERRNVNNARRERVAEELYSKRWSYVFVFLVGFAFVVGGSAMTWWGTASEVKDMLLLGPGSIVIGAVFVCAGIVFVARMHYYQRRARATSCVDVDDDVDVEKCVGLPEAKTPPNTVLYGDNIAAPVTPPIYYTPESGMAPKTGAQDQAAGSGTPTDRPRGNQTGQRVGEASGFPVSDTTAGRNGDEQIAGKYPEQPKTGSTRNSRPDSGYEGI